MDAPPRTVSENRPESSARDARIAARSKMRIADMSGLSEDDRIAAGFGARVLKNGALRERHVEAIAGFHFVPRAVAFHDQLPVDQPDILVLRRLGNDWRHRRACTGRKRHINEIGRDRKTRRRHGAAYITVSGSRQTGCSASRRMGMGASGALAKKPDRVSFSGPAAAPAAPPSGLPRRARSSRSSRGSPLTRWPADPASSPAASAAPSASGRYSFQDRRSKFPL